ncbi:MAG: hypothetical protein II437_02040 [Oscillospiraceae bacterium]|jgi:UPF0042 nucleotide-binding protein|nr:hypothetical protein [Oscillospiraceae bacterium]
MSGYTLISFGYRYGLPAEADLVFDTRGLPNPFYVPELREKTGLDAEVRSYVFSVPESEAYLSAILEVLRLRLVLFEQWNSPLRHPLTVAVGCTGGRHRSVSMTVRLAEALQAQGVPVTVFHRDVARTQDA